MTLLLLFVAATVASTFDAIAGGGGLLTLPSLLLAGFDPVSALATNKVQSSLGATSATWVYARRGLLAGRWPWVFATAGALGAAAGGACASLVSPRLLQAVFPILLLAAAAYFLLSRRLGDEDRHARLAPAPFALLLAAPIGFYDSVFGPGTGAFLTLAFVGLLGCGLTRATAQAKLVNAASNWGALAVFALVGRPHWATGLVMAVGAILGGQIGSRLALRHGARLIKPILVAMACAMAAKLLADPANPLRQALAR